MVSSFYKWLFMLLPVSLFSINENGSGEFSFSAYQGKAGPHPFHVSVAEINHNASEKTLEISCKIFIDDFEKALKQNYKTKVDLINPPDKAAMDTLVKKYITSHLSLIADGNPVSLTYIGYERDQEAVYGYLQGDHIAMPKKIDITNKLMYDLFTDQANIMHVIVDGKRKSKKLDYPVATASISF